MRLSSWFVFVAVVTTSCSSDLADEMTLVTRISHEVGNLSCEGGALTFDIRAPVARAAAVVMLAEQNELDEAACEVIISDVTAFDKTLGKTTKSPKVINSAIGEGVADAHLDRF